MTDIKRAFKRGDSGIERVSKYLATQRGHTDIINVEDHEKFRKWGVDLLWQTAFGIVLIDVKSDSYDTGNFFFETVSNKDKNTLGCFLSSEADYFYYVFEERNELYIIELEPVRTWFLENQHRFKVKNPSTTTRGVVFYQSEGYIVPISILCSEMGAHVKKVKLTTILDCYI